MPVEAQVHSTTRRAVAIVGFALLLAALLLGIRKLSEAEPGTLKAGTPTLAIAAYIAPVINLKIEDAANESSWSAALALALSGKTEVPVTNGRIDVLSDAYAIEVDRLEKWHEGIGQAAHYGLASGRVPCLALIVDSDRWPLNEATLAKLRTIEQTALAKGIKLLLLRRIPPDA